MSEFSQQYLNTSAEHLKQKPSVAEHTILCYTKNKKEGTYMKKKWEDADVQWLSDNYVLLGYRKCAEHLGRGTGSILHMASKLGTKRKGEGREDRITIFEGYIQISSADDRYFLHRRMMEQILGRRLSADEVVHHIDGNGLNNDPANLELTTRAEHQSIIHKDALSERRDPATGRFLSR